MTKPRWAIRIKHGRIVIAPVGRQNIHLRFPLVTPGALVA